MIYRGMYRKSKKPRLGCIVPKYICMYPRDAQNKYLISHTDRIYQIFDFWENP